VRIIACTLKPAAGPNRCGEPAAPVPDAGEARRLELAILRR